MTPVRVQRCIVGAVVLAVPWLACVEATEISWTNEAGGAFQAPGNWNPNTVPGPHDKAVFDLATRPYTVTWHGSVSNHSFAVAGGDVTWNLKGYTYRLNTHGTNSIGLLTTPADLTLSSGTVTRVDAVYLGGFNTSFRLQGTGTTFRVNAGGKYLGAYYGYYGRGTSLIVDGPGAEFSGLGYSIGCRGSMVVTNGGFLNLSSGLTLESGSDLRVSGPGYRATLTPYVRPGSVACFHNGAVVRCSYGSPNHTLTIGGTLMLQDAQFYYYDIGTLVLDGTHAVLAGDGRVEFRLTQNSGGVIRPGGPGGVGCLVFAGDLANTTSTGIIDIELGGDATNEYDRLVLTTGSGGNGTLYAGGILNVTWINGFEPEHESTFDILDFVTIEGVFGKVNLPGQGLWTTNDLHVTGQITYVPPPIGTILLTQ